MPQDGYYFPLAAPNDLALLRSGTLFFTSRPGNPDPTKGNPNAVYQLDLGTKQPGGRILHRVLEWKNVQMPNGIVSSPDDKVLYVIEAHPDLFSSFALLPQPEERLRELASISHTLPELYLRAPRSFAYMSLSLGIDSLALFRRWRAAGGAWEEFVAVAGDEAAAELLAWDDVAAQVSQESFAEGAAELLPRPTGRILRTAHDLPRLAAGLAEGRIDLSAEPVALAVHRTESGVVTTKVEPRVADLLEELREAPGPVPEGLQPALDTLEKAGLIRYT